MAVNGIQAGQWLPARSGKERQNRLAAPRGPWLACASVQALLQGHSRNKALHLQHACYCSPTGSSILEVSVAVEQGDNTQNFLHQAHPSLGEIDANPPPSPQRTTNAERWPASLHTNSPSSWSGRAATCCTTRPLPAAVLTCRTNTTPSPDHIRPAIHTIAPNSNSLTPRRPHDPCTMYTYL